MNREQLVVTSSPHIRDVTTVNQIMWSVVFSLVPAIVAAVWFFKINALLVISVTVVFALLTEVIFQIARGKEVTINDGSAVITGILLALTLPPTIPLWIAALGSVVAVGLGKQVFGGLGYNPFNPALVGRAFLIAAYPVPMTTWILDGQTTATPLNLMKSDGILTDYWDLFIGHIGGCLGETSALALLLGAVYLIYKGYIDWRIPAGMLGSVFVLTMLSGQDPVFHLFAGGLVLGAFYMATDMVTTPVTKMGRWIFGVGAGLIVVVIRLWGGYPEGVLFSILLMNMTVPILNRYTRPRSLGEVKAGAK
ncbi:RnfABCDGE type electron transport complex subunit D [Halothermothrix orenii]|uniref:Ion-translocating oxidoreductase complex subunit D n=1 Tax=Halothermothrix orenii (strain H 168 / OCM 544 / DSM 9562) TaxID=373903 RepID=B8CY14_HALOH|nr:RnfABCDGE type electron transport complex subunit D [Halothermothrix orenii]ACL70183.1 electron transport complex, RnfABCDGE type, D subunit [Halothermothrix orenii H 168]